MAAIERGTTLIDSTWLALIVAAVLAGCGPPSPQEGHDPTTGQRVPVDMQVIETDQGRVFVRQRRSPAAQVVLAAIHGGPGMQSDYLWELDRVASDQLSFVTYDQHGAGRSRPSNFTMTMSGYTAELERVIDFSEHDRTILFGHSWGALVAVNYAAQHPDQIIGLILMGPAPLTFQQLSEGARRFQGRVEELVAEGLISTNTDLSNPANLLPAYFADPTFQAPAPLAGISYSSNANALTWQALGDYDFERQAGMVAAPSLVLWGEQDPFGSEWGRTVARATGESGSRLVMLEGCGHYWHECPGQFYEQVEGFLDQLGAR